MKLWRFNKITGFWVYERSCLPEEAQEWLAVFQRISPSEIFRLSKTKPKGFPKEISS